MALRQTQQNSDKQFATQKAMTILEELRSIAQGSAQTIVVLDEYNDGVTNTYPVLTSDKSVIDPLHATSGNIRSGSRWVYHRQILIERLPGQSSNGVRLVRVRILKEEKKQKRVIAEVASVLRTDFCAEDRRELDRSEGRPADRHAPRRRRQEPALCRQLSAHHQAAPAAADSP